MSGHRRKKACELAGFETVKAEIKELNRDEAIILMVESNYQRSSILPSEKAFAYKMRFDALKRKETRTDLTCDPVGHKSDGTKSVAVIADDSPDSKTQVQRYIRLTELVPEIRDLVDEGKIELRSAVELSYLSAKEQECLVEQIVYHCSIRRSWQCAATHTLRQGVVHSVHLDILAHKPYCSLQTGFVSVCRM